MHHFLIEAIVLVLGISVIPMAAVAAVCGIVAAIQSATQIQEQSILHLARLIVFSSMLYFCGDFAFLQIQSLFIRSLTAVESVGHS